MKRKILHKTPVVNICTGKDALTCTQVQNLLGWEVEGETPFGQDFLLRDQDGMKVRCLNNQRNRRLVKRHMMKIARDILGGHWKFNMQPIIVGKTGLILSGQHRLIALFWAVALWYQNPEEYPFWKSEPTLDTLIAFGCDEDDTVVNTIDTGKTRNLTDVLYRSENFAKLEAKKRHKVSRAVDHAIKQLWDRTQVPSDEAPVPRTHSQSIQFLEEHPELVECVMTTLALNQDRESRLSVYLPLGLMSCVFYLMVTSKTDTDAFYEQGVDAIDFSLREKAEAFLEMLAEGAKELVPVRQVLGRIEGGGSLNERLWVLSKAWQRFSSGIQITQAKIKPSYIESSEGFKVLKYTPVVGGLDAGFSEE